MSRGQGHRNWRPGRFGRGGGSGGGGTWPRWLQWAAIAVLIVNGALATRYGGGGSATGGRSGGSGAEVPREPVSGTVRLVDGDSFFIDGREVRLVGIDAPEGPQTCTRDGRQWPCGEESRRTLQRLIGGQRVSCRATEADQHGRLLGVCAAGEVELNREMVRSGYALAYGRYEAEERDAKAGRRGVWSGEFQRPRDWRRDHGIGR